MYSSSTGILFAKPSPLSSTVALPYATQAMAENAAVPRPRPAKARSRTDLEQVKAALDACRHDLDLQFQRMAQMQAEIDRLKADTQRSTASSSPASIPESEPSSE
jgi:hypothetical protein